MALMYILFLRYRGGRIFGTESLAETIRYFANFVPFKTIGTYFTRIFEGSINISIAVENLLGNLLIFLPFGFYLPFISGKFSKLSIYAIWLALIILIVEITQLITRRGSFDVDDFILNFSGAIIGWLIFTKTPVRKLLNN